MKVLLTLQKQSWAVGHQRTDVIDKTMLVALMVAEWENCIRRYFLRVSHLTGLYTYSSHSEV